MLSTKDATLLCRSTTRTLSSRVLPRGHVHPAARVSARALEPSVCSTTRTSCSHASEGNVTRGGSRWDRAWQGVAVALISLQVLLLGGTCAPSALAVIAPPDRDLDTFENIPSQLSSPSTGPDVPLSSVVSGPKKKEIESCTRKCVPTCIRGGDGAPGLGPISVRKDIVVFKEGFRSRQYCLSECAQVCALSLDKDKAALLLPNGDSQQQP